MIECKGKSGDNNDSSIGQNRTNDPKVVTSTGSWGPERTLNTRRRRKASTFALRIDQKDWDNEVIMFDEDRTNSPNVEQGMSRRSPRTAGSTPRRLTATAFTPRIKRKGCNDEGIIRVEDQTNSAIGVENTSGWGHRLDRDTLKVFVLLWHTRSLVVRADLVKVFQLKGTEKSSIAETSHSATIQPQNTRIARGIVDTTLDE